MKWRVRPYLGKDNMRDGAFYVANKLYGIALKLKIFQHHTKKRQLNAKTKMVHLGGVVWTFPRESKEEAHGCSGYRSCKPMKTASITSVI